MKNYTLEKRKEFIRYVTKIVHEWTCHLEIFSLPQAIENSRQFLLLRTDILQKIVVGCPESWHQWNFLLHDGTVFTDLVYSKISFCKLSSEISSTILKFYLKGFLEW